MSESDRKPNVQTDPAQPEKPAAAPPVQPGPPVETPLTGSSKAEKAVEYLNRLRTMGNFDPNLPLSNERAKEIAAHVSKLAKEEVSVSTIKDARGRLLKLAVQAVNHSAEKGGEDGKTVAASSHPTPKTPPASLPTTQATAGSSAEAPKEKTPLTPAEKEANSKFVNRVVTWTLEKAEANAPPEDREFIIGTYNDALNDSNSKVPGAIKILLASGMLIYYLAKNVSKIRAKLQKGKPQQIPGNDEGPIVEGKTVDKK
jgi:hypothetical protein